MFIIAEQIDILKTTFDKSYYCSIIISLTLSLIFHGCSTIDDNSVISGLPGTYSDGTSKLYMIDEQGYITSSSDGGSSYKEMGWLLHYSKISEVQPSAKWAIQKNSDSLTLTQISKDVLLLESPQFVDTLLRIQKDFNGLFFQRYVSSDIEIKECSSDKVRAIINYNANTDIFELSITKGSDTIYKSDLPSKYDYNSFSVDKIGPILNGFQLSVSYGSINKVFVDYIFECGKKQFYLYKVKKTVLYGKDPSEPDTSILHLDTLIPLKEVDIEKWLAV